MYLCAPCLARFFVLCQVYSNSRHLKSASFAASLADLRPATLCRPRDPQQGEPRPRACFVSTLNKERGTRARFARGFVAWSMCQCSLVEYVLPLNFMQRY
jgi:hypothetical protein